MPSDISYWLRTDLARNSGEVLEEIVTLIENGLLGGGFTMIAQLRFPL
ncbi:hypothetical protein [Curtobacterium aetherium]|uniref:Uncharacterized protein n=1 Tax=Curtobacterium aetherium TaxID=2841594 RepID=A0ACD1E833_9MICO|nr:hypothetical protein [Curtobacterium sp. L6-1]QWS34912.1 hypothetical protein KM842_07255 [Curtobacterium sp. L6-1]